MKLSEDEAKRFLERLCPLQETEQQLLCPRCGRNELYSGLYFFLNSLSRYAHVPKRPFYFPLPSSTSCLPQKLPHR